MSKNLLPIVGLMFAFGFFGCEKLVLDSPTEMSATNTEPISALGKKGGNGPPSSGVALIVTYRDDPADHIVSDGRGDYIDGELGVKAIINSLDNFLFDPQSKKVKNPRSVTFDYMDPVDPNDCNKESACDLFSLRGHFSVDDLILVPVGESEERSVQLLARGRLMFDSAIEVNGVRASNLLVSHPDSDTWIVETRPGEEIAARIRKIGKGKNATTDTTLYHMPFEITVVRKP